MFQRGPGAPPGKGPKRGPGATRSQQPAEKGFRGKPGPRGPQKKARPGEAKVAWGPPNPLGQKFFHHVPGLGYIGVKRRPDAREVARGRSPPVQPPTGMKTKFASRSPKGVVIHERDEPHHATSPRRERGRRIFVVVAPRCRIARRFAACRRWASRVTARWGNWLLEVSPVRTPACRA